MSDYKQWKRNAGADVRISGWTGWALGTVMACALYSLPVYLIVSIFSQRIDWLPSTPVEFAVWGGIALVMFTRAAKNSRPDHLPQPNQR